jgi:hypothetical protein
MTISVYVHEYALSDGGLVYDVALGSIRIPAISEHDAYELAAKICEAIEAHSNETAEEQFT